MPRRSSVLLLTLVSGTACTELGGTGSGELPNTAISVDPAQFLGDVACTTAPGGMQVYVATLTDLTPAPDAAPKVNAEFVYPSSSPTPCYLPVHFHRVVDNHQYVADIEGYDRADLTPIAVGIHTLVDSTGAIATPRWRTSCGRSSENATAPPPSGGGTTASDAGDSGRSDAAADATAGSFDATAPLIDATPARDARAASADAPVNGQPVANARPTTAIALQTIVIRDCLPLVDLEPGSTPTGIIVDLTTALGTLECGADTTNVASFEATLRQSGQTLSAPCGETVTFVATEDTEYTIDVTATQNDGTQWTTSCFQVARKGLELRAQCDPLIRVSDAGVTVDGGSNDGGSTDGGNTGDSAPPDAQNP